MTDTPDTLPATQSGMTDELDLQKLIEQCKAKHPKHFSIETIDAVRDFLTLAGQVVVSKADYATLTSRAELAEARVRELEDALKEIVRAHLGDCPAAMDPEGSAILHINRLRYIARNALEAQP